MRINKDILDRSWKTIYNLKLKELPENRWYESLHEHTVVSGIPLVEMYEHLLTNYVLPSVLFDKLTDAVTRLKVFYGN